MGVSLAVAVESRGIIDQKLGQKICFREISLVVFWNQKNFDPCSSTHMTRVFVIVFGVLFILRCSSFCFVVEICSLTAYR